MPRTRKPYTEIRIEHETIEDKQQYEQELDEALKKNGYVTRLEYIRECIRNLTKGQ